MASATVSGTVGWESVVRGKPSLLFGNSWYRECRGVFVIRTVDECKDALEKISKGFRINGDDIINYAKTIEQNAIRGYIDIFYEKLNVVDRDENIENLAQAIDAFIL